VKSERERVNADGTIYTHEMSTGNHDLGKLRKIRTLRVVLFGYLRRNDTLRTLFRYEREVIQGNFL
jgi:hypothetical protein